MSSQRLDTGTESIVSLNSTGEGSASDPEFDIRPHRRHLSDATRYAAFARPSPPAPLSQPWLDDETLSGTDAPGGSTGQFGTYAEYVDCLVQNHEHLKPLADFFRRSANASGRPSWERYRISVLDVFHSESLEKLAPLPGLQDHYVSQFQGARTLIQYLPSVPGGEKLLRSFLLDPESNVAARTIIVQGSTPENLGLLGEVFDIDPTFFVDHLEPQLSETNGFAQVHVVNPFRKKPFLHLDVERLHCIETHPLIHKTLHPEKFARELVDFIPDLERRVAAAGNPVPPMRLAHAGKLCVDTKVHFLCRDRVSHYRCERTSIPTDIYLFYTMVTGEHLNQSHLVALERDKSIPPAIWRPLPRFSKGRAVELQSPSSASRQLHHLLQIWHRSFENKTKPATASISCLYAAVVSDWATTLGHMHRLMCLFERDASLITSGSTHMSLGEFRHLLFEYKEIVSQIRRSATRDIAPEDEIHHELSSQIVIITTLIERADKTTASHTGFLAIEESRKAILQAEAVRRLTNLAFIFLPLSWTTSIYGMNVAEFGTGEVKLWVVAVTALVTTAMAVSAAIHWHIVRWIILAAWWSAVWPFVMAYRFIVLTMRETDRSPETRALSDPTKDPLPATRLRRFLADKEL